MRWWVTGRQGRRRRKLLDDLKERRGYSHLKEGALDRTMWRARFGRGFGPVVGQTAKWMNIVYLWCRTIRFIAGSYGRDEGSFLLNRTKVRCIFFHPVVNLHVQKVQHKECHRCLRFHRSRKPNCVKTVLWETIKTNLQAELLPTAYVTRWNWAYT